MTQPATMFIPAERFKNIKKSAIRRLYERAPAGSINLGLGEPNFQTPDVIRRAGVRAIEQGQNSYTSNAGLLELRERIAEYHSRDSALALGVNSVCVTNGSEEALFALIMAAAGPGDEVLLPDP
ncbi:MAG TPA: aminotransferase class I/II-fold pyridoxal phosphate-dependent enzyme, partial [Blastocatellia bacterium]|nr:aminotransferase class I/II-fold pyridoxal phosphate-dependent enzyme [Blastocatellia bacterium]